MSHLWSTELSLNMVEKDFLAWNIASLVESNNKMLDEIRREHEDLRKLIKGEFEALHDKEIAITKLIQNYVLDRIQAEEKKPLRS